MLDDRELQGRLDRLPRARIGLLPTPLQECPRLGAELGGIRILVKRDDLTGLGFGGNKVRGLEFIAGLALEQGADTFVTWGLASAVENHCRLTAAVAARAGLQCHVVLGGKPYAPYRANARLCRLLGAEFHLVDAEGTGQLRKACHDLMDELRAAGRRPYLVDAQHAFYGGYASVGYTQCVLEMRRQFEASGISPGYIYTCSEGGTQAGVILGKLLTGAPFRVVGFAPTVTGSGLKEDIARWATEGAGLLGVDLDVALDDIENCSEFASDDNATATEACSDAIRLAATTEAMMLDPVYTGKAMAGLISHARTGRLRRGNTVVFLHTGGTPVLFDFLDEAGRAQAIAGTPAMYYEANSVHSRFRRDGE